MSGELTSSDEAPPGLSGPGDPARVDLDNEDLPVFPIFDDATSGLSACVSPLLKFDDEVRGLSVLPRIFDPRPRSDRVDSLVSALLKEG